jgi:hypothetical protein
MPSAAKVAYSPLHSASHRRARLLGEPEEPKKHAGVVIQFRPAKAAAENRAFLRHIERCARRSQKVIIDVEPIDESFPNGEIGTHLKRLFGNTSLSDTCLHGICVFIRTQTDTSCKWVGRFRAYEIPAADAEPFHLFADPIVLEAFRNNGLHERFVALRAMSLLARGTPINRLVSAPCDEAEKVGNMGFKEVRMKDLDGFPLTLVEVGKYSRRKNSSLETGLMRLEEAAFPKYRRLAEEMLETETIQFVSRTGEVKDIRVELSSRLRKQIAIAIEG